MARRRVRKGKAARDDSVVGGWFGYLAIAGLALASIVVLFFWQAPADTSGALMDMLVQFYRPVLWVVLFVATVVLLGPVVAWILRRGVR